MSASSQTEHTTSKTRRAMHWNGASRLKRCWSITTATVWPAPQPPPGNHDSSLLPPIAAVCNVVSQVVYQQPATW